MKFITALIAVIFTMVGFYMLILAARCLALLTSTVDGSVALSLTFASVVTLTIAALCLRGAFKSRDLVRHFLPDAA